MYGGPQVSHANKKAMTCPQTKATARTTAKATAQKKNSRHKRKSHGRSHGTKAKATAQEKKIDTHSVHLGSLLRCDY